MYVKQSNVWCAMPSSVQPVLVKGTCVYQQRPTQDAYKLSRGCCMTGHVSMQVSSHQEHSETKGPSRANASLILLEELDLQVDLDASSMSSLAKLIASSKVLTSNVWNMTNVFGQILGHCVCVIFVITVELVEPPA